MNADAPRSPSVLANLAYGVLNPIPFGCFAAALVFDVVYLRSAEVLWNKGAAWLIAFGLVAAVIPRLIQLTQVWISSRALAGWADRLDFWLNLLAVAAAIGNSFVHSRDAYAVVPAGVGLSACTVALLALGQVALAVQAARRGELR